MLITAVVPGQTQEGYDEAMKILRPLLNEAEGFIAHGAGMSPEGWRVFRGVGITGTSHRIFRQTYPSEFAAGRHTQADLSPPPLVSCGRCRCDE